MLLSLLWRASMREDYPILKRAAMTIKDRVAVPERGSAQHDKQIKAIRALVEQGMHLLVETRKEARATRKDLRTLTSNVNRLVNGLRPTNGHTSRKVDLQ